MSGPAPPRAARPADVGVPGPSALEMARAFRSVRADPLGFLGEVTQRFGDLVAFPVPGPPALLVNGQYATVALTDPFGRGWFAAHDRMHGVTTSFLSNHASVTVIYSLQAAGIVIGHIIAVLVAHHISLRLDPGRRAALLGQLPLAVLMVAYTLFGLWLLSTPAAG